MDSENEHLYESGADQAAGWLIGDVGELEDRKIPLDLPRVVLGRDRDFCRVVLSQAFISKQQVAFEVGQDGRVTAKHLGSRSNTYVNGVPLSEQVLSDGDQIGFGPGGVLSFTFREFAEPLSSRIAESKAAAAGLGKPAATPTRSGTANRFGTASDPKASRITRCVSAVRRIMTSSWMDRACPGITPH